MTKFAETAAAASFIATAASRETSVEIMEAIAALACSEIEAARIWDAPTAEELAAIAVLVTRDADDFFWGDNTLAEIINA
jgi:hypothetical protein